MARKKPKVDADAAKKRLTAPRKPKAVDWSRGLSTGSTLLNLACCGRTSVGLLPGMIYLFVGDSQAGKTWVAREILAQASVNPIYDQYRLFHNDTERGALMDIESYFGPALAERLEEPPGGASRSLDGFYSHLIEQAEQGPFIEVIDSEDALEHDADGEGYNTARARLHSTKLRKARNNVEDTGSILIIVKQSRDAVGFGAQFNPKTRSGGRALTFYATLEVWFSVREKIKTTVFGKDVRQGTVLKIHVKKNRESGREWAIEIPHYPDHGIDDVGSMVDWMVEWKGFKVDKGEVIAPALGFRGDAEGLIRHVEATDQEGELKALVADHWQKVEEMLKVDRKKRY